ncbi:MAG TPA: family 1 glycosylhydrolase [Candidatus Dormibacteraeota bacterium]|nr:family 1 glycosylhydrolase [Candidatus Dormibacteraeota bacterium]
MSGDLRFPEGFLWGCATAAHQVEGGLTNDWSEFERRPGAIADGGSARLACDHHARFREDLRLLAGLGNNAHRFGIEWSRIEPEEGRFDPAALEHYDAVVDECVALGLEPVVTLLHFTLPVWLARRGGVCAPDAPARFARAAAVCAARYGGRVRWWCTVNEPLVQATLGYLRGEWPPARRSLGACLAAVRGLLRMHAAAAAALRSVSERAGREARIGCAHHVRGMRPARPSSLADAAVAAVPDHLFNRWWLRACREGRMLPPLGTGSTVAGLAGSLDWVGLNYYCDDLVRFDWRRPRELFTRQYADPALPASSFGWAIEPDGLRRALHLVADVSGLPVLVTENGVADTADELRPRFLVDHVAAVHRAVEEGVDVRGYLHWTSMDNFEWAAGYTQRFGLVSVDRQTLERSPKPSAAVYERICRTNGVPRDLLDL